MTPSRRMESPGAVPDGILLLFFFFFSPASCRVVELGNNLFTHSLSHLGGCWIIRVVSDYKE